MCVCFAVVFLDYISLVKSDYRLYRRSTIGVGFIIGDYDGYEIDVRRKTNNDFDWLCYPIFGFLSKLWTSRKQD